MVNRMSDRISPAAATILEGLNEALADAKGEAVPGMKKTTVYPSGNGSGDYTKEKYLRPEPSMEVLVAELMEDSDEE